MANFSLAKIAALAVVATSIGAAAVAAEVTIFTSMAPKGALEEIVPIYERKSGNHVILEVSAPTEVNRKVATGEPFDLVIGNSATLASHQKSGLISDAIPFGTIFVAFVFRKGADQPDVSTPDALRLVLQRAKSISHSDPTQGGSSAILFNSIVASLGMVDEIKQKTILTEAGAGAGPVAEGKAEFGIAQSSEIIGLKDIDSIKFMPSDSRSLSVFAAAISTKSNQIVADRGFLDVLNSPEVKAILRNWGFSN